ncbi:MAG: hypothetical protein HY755_06190 [Nitrospirae bacterium]|nr:hypothetical protein [Nitrospirota bacterium]
MRQSPINLRPILGIKPQESTKGRGYMARGYLNMLRLTKDHRYEEKAVKCLDWLIKNKSPYYEKYSWANHFDFASRSGRYAKHESIIVWTALIGQAFLDAYEVLGDKKYLDVATSVCGWILNLPREKTDSGTCISYLACEQSSIHNSNMLGSAMLARTAKFTGNKELLKVAKEAMEYSCLRQLQNGAWYYGEATNQHWIDNFHTGYNLDSLKCYIENTNDKAYEDNLRVGFEFFKNNFFEESGRPKYYHNRTYPVDSQCASQAIETLANFADYDKNSLSLAMKVAKWTIANMQDKDGHFYYRQYPIGIKAKTPMLHWAQTTTYKALVLLLSKIRTNQQLNP